MAILRVIIIEGHISCGNNKLQNSTTYRIALNCISCTHDDHTTKNLSTINHDTIVFI